MYVDDEEEDELPIPDSWKEEDDIEDMKRRHPGHSENAYQTGKMLGVDFPYVPGDPFW